MKKLKAIFYLLLADEWVVWTLGKTRSMSRRDCLATCKDAVELMIDDIQRKEQKQ